MTNVPPSPRLLDLLRICLDLGEDERQQFCALSGDAAFDPDKVAAELYLKGGPKFVLYETDGAPYCAGGYESVGLGVMQSWMIGTPSGWERHWKEITRATRRVMQAVFDHTDVYRLQTHCLSSRVQAMKWYAAIGLKQERVLPAFTADGDGLAIFARTRET